MDTYALTNMHSVCPGAAAQRDAIGTVAKDELERLEAGRRLFLAARRLAVAQRFALYAHDELAMATMRLRIRLPGERVKAHEFKLKMHSEEVPARNNVRGALPLGKQSCLPVAQEQVEDTTELAEGNRLLVCASCSDTDQNQDGPRGLGLHQECLDVEYGY